MQKNPNFAAKIVITLAHYANCSLLLGVLVALGMLGAACNKKDNTNTGTNTPATAEPAPFTPAANPQTALVRTWAFVDVINTDSLSAEEREKRIAANRKDVKFRFMADGSFAANIRIDGDLLPFGGRWKLNSDTLILNGTVQNHLRTDTLTAKVGERSLILKSADGAQLILKAE